MGHCDDNAIVKIIQMVVGLTTTLKVIV